ncbi:hypothetical protein AVEN_253225-1 [Araneus ventricosus]|uniref:Uncharacterized protein n=1 Tax=Araneus ventricosus TaxID=182803 RepID=A0A4Y2A9K7_ARAVE|nr:hypothetical protein AVEN_253225-1 [Araneus ventricosus]
MEKILKSIHLEGNLQSKTRQVDLPFLESVRLVMEEMKKERKQKLDDVKRKVLNKANQSIDKDYGVLKGKILQSISLGKKNKPINTEVKSNTEAGTRIVTENSFAQETKVQMDDHVSDETGELSDTSRVDSVLKQQKIMSLEKLNSHSKIIHCLVWSKKRKHWNLLALVLLKERILMQ